MRAYRAASMLLAIATTVVGLAMLVATLAGGGGPAATGVVVGVLLTAFGALRLYLLVRTGD